MTKRNKFLDKLLDGAADENISFRDLCRLLKRLGFEERVKGDHHIFTLDGVTEIVNLQPKGSKAKGYQVKQVRDLIIDYQLGEAEDEQV